MQNINPSQLEQDLQKFKLPGPLLVSRVEERLPFGMMRRIPMVRRLPGASGAGSVGKKEDFDAASLMILMRNPPPMTQMTQMNVPNVPMTQMNVPNVPMTTIQPNVPAQRKQITFTDYGASIKSVSNCKSACRSDSIGKSDSITQIATIQSTIQSAQSTQLPPNPGALYFDQSLLLFTRPDGSFNPTLISSNFNGSVTGDRAHFAAILRSGCWLLPTAAALNHPRLPLTANNKLKLIKCAEFMAREWPTGIDVSQLGGVAIVRPERAVLTAHPNLLSVCGEVGPRTGLYWYLMGGTRCVDWKEKGLPFNFTASEGDWIVLMRKGALGHGPSAGASSTPSASSALGHGSSTASTATSAPPSDTFISELKRLLMSSDVIDDLELKVKEITPSDITAIIASRVTQANRLDQLLSASKVNGNSTSTTTTSTTNIAPSSTTTTNTVPSSTTSLSTIAPSSTTSLSTAPLIKLVHVCHLDSRRGALTRDVVPGRFGSTTRHCVIYRPPFLAALHHDASKINRFAPTIDYIVKKMIFQGSGRVGRLDLKRISEIQYYAYVLLHEGHLYGVVGGGASILLLWPGGEQSMVIEEASLIHKLAIPSPPGTRLFLLSPHFYPLRDAKEPEEAFARYCRDRQIDLHHPKLSFAHFELV